MKRSIKLAVAAAVALSATSAFATNGDTLIGLGAKARGMGGVGIGMSHGAESALANPALITSVKGTEISFGGTVFMPDVETDLGTGGGSLSSDADLNVIPEVAIASKASDNFWWGIGMWGTAGMGTDYRDALDTSAIEAAVMQVYANAGFFPGQDATTDMMAAMTGMGLASAQNFGMITNLQLMQFGVPLAYKSEGFSIGVAPILQYGSLDINYYGSTTEGVAQDFGIGYDIGLAYETNGLTVGASYKSAIDMNYKGQIANAASDFGLSGFDNHLEQPAEIGVGVSYAVDGHTFAFDYKKIKWGDAKGYQDFGWEDQNVYIFGYQYAQDNWAVRLGYNHASSPIKEQNGATYAGAAINMFNLLGFPAMVEDHYTVGGSYAFSKLVSLDLAYTYADSTTETFDTSGMFGPGAEVSTKHSQQGVSAQLNFNF